MGVITSQFLINVSSAMKLVHSVKVQPKRIASNAIQGISLYDPLVLCLARNSSLRILMIQKILFVKFVMKHALSALDLVILGNASPVLRDTVIHYLIVKELVSNYVVMASRLEMKNVMMVTWRIMMVAQTIAN